MGCGNCIVQADGQQLLSVAQFLSVGYAQIKYIRTHFYTEVCVHGLVRSSLAAAPRTNGSLSHMILGPTIVFTSSGKALIAMIVGPSSSFARDDDQPSLRWKLE